MHLLITCIRTMLIPLASSNVGIRREIENTTSTTMNRMEEKVNSIVQRTIDVALAWVTKLLATQKKNDFRPRDDGPGSGGGEWLQMLQTPVCSPSLKARFHEGLTNTTPPDMSLNLHFPHPPPQPYSQRPHPITQSTIFSHRNRHWPPHFSL